MNVKDNRQKHDYFQESLELHEKLQGKINVKSDEGKGSTFTVNFMKKV